MGRKKKRAAPNPRERIFCYYCDRTFNTEQELLMHQREKHLRCPTCNKRMLSIPSLTIHSEQMHNVTVTSVPYAIPGRTSTHVDVLGMKGVPEEYYLALEGKSSKKVNYDNAAYQAYPPQQAYPQSQGYAAHAYPPQLYGSQPYAQTYPNQYPPQYGYPVQGYPTHSYPPQGYAYPPQQGYTAPAYPTHPGSYPQQTYGPQKPPAQDQPQQASQYTAQYPTYSHPTSKVASSRPQPKPQPQSNGPRPVPDEKPPPLPSGEKPAADARTGQSAGPPAPTDSPSGKPSTQSEPGITVVFDRVDLSMEELRAQLPQYRVSTPKS